MTTEQKIIDSKIAAKDIIEDLERVILRVRQVCDHRPSQEIDAESRELFYLQLAIVNTHGAAAEAKAELLRVIGMPKFTTFVRSLPIRR